jgi:hypothetical protein
MKIQLNAAARLQATEEVDAAGFPDWPKDRQDKYLKEHPGSKYGKGGPKKPETTSELPAKKPTSIPITHARAFFPKQFATLTNLKNGETTTFRVGKDMHTITRKGNTLEMSKKSVSNKP